jgi:large subunit ribosomal protein L22
MDIKATQKFLLQSPRKLRPIVAAIKKMTPSEAIERLPFVARRASEPLEKVIKQAIANAKVRGLSEIDLKFKEIQISEGPRLKRGRPVSRGQWHPIKKRMSHIMVVLEVKKSEVKKVEAVKEEKVEVKSEVKKVTKKETK